MKNDAPLEDKIEQYLLGRLPRDEYLEMERAIREQPDLAEEVELRRLEFDTAEELIARDIRAHFRRLRDQEKDEGQQPEPKGKMFGSRRLWYYLAAAVLLPLGFLLYRYWPEDQTNKIPLPPDPVQTDSLDQSQVATTKKDTVQQEVSPGQSGKIKSHTRLLAMAERAYRNSKWSDLSTGRNGDPDKTNPVTLAAAAIGRKEYQEAIRHLEKAGDENAQAQLLKAHAYFGLRRFGEAARVAATLTKAPYREEAEWLRVLALAADGKTKTNAYKSLSGKMLTDEGHSFYADMLAFEKGERDESKSPENAPIASADMAPNSSIEPYVEGNSRSENLTIIINSPQNDAFFPNKKGEALIRFAGTVEGAPDNTLTLDVYDNKSAFGKPLVSLPLDLKKDATTNALSFDFQYRLIAPPGLYYFTIGQQGRAPAYAGKFMVRN